MFEFCGAAAFLLEFCGVLSPELCGAAFGVLRFVEETLLDSAGLLAVDASSEDSAEAARLPPLLPVDCSFLSLDTAA